VKPLNNSSIAPHRHRTDFISVFNQEYISPHRNIPVSNRARVADVCHLVERELLFPQPDRFPPSSDDVDPHSDASLRLRFRLRLRSGWTLANGVGRIGEKVQEASSPSSHSPRRGRGRQPQPRRVCPISARRGAGGSGRARAGNDPRGVGDSHRVRQEWSRGG
jgi:hypothetical protein